MRSLIMGSPVRHIGGTRRRKRNRGQVIGFVLVCMFVLLGFGGLAIDASMLFTARNQLQQALDMAALRGAVAMISMPTANVEDSIRPYVLRALRFNPVMGDSDVTWPWTLAIRDGGGGLADTVVLTGIYRMQPLFSNIFPSVDTISVATQSLAKLESVAAVYCVMPYTLTDRFVDNNGNRTWDPGVDFYSPLTTGYDGSRETGLDWEITVSYHNIAEAPRLNTLYGVGYNVGLMQEDRNDEFPCNSGNLLIGRGSVLTLTNHANGILDLKAQNRINHDPNARWDQDTRTVIPSERYPVLFESPRIVKIPVHSPNRRELVVKIMSVFITGTNDVAGTVTAIPINILNYGGGTSSADNLSFVKSARLVRPAR